MACKKLMQSKGESFVGRRTFIIINICVWYDVTFVSQLKAVVSYSSNKRNWLLSIWVVMKFTFQAQQKIFQVPQKYFKIYKNTSSTTEKYFRFQNKIKLDSPPAPLPRPGRPVPPGQARWCRGWRGRCARPRCWPRCPPTGPRTCTVQYSTVHTVQDFVPRLSEGGHHHHAQPAPASVHDNLARHAGEDSH